MNFSRKILAVPFITLTLSQVCFAATASPTPTFMVDPTAFQTVQPAAIDPTAVTPPPTATTTPPPPPPTAVTPPPTATPPASTTTTDPNGTLVTTTPPPATPPAATTTPPPSSVGILVPPPQPPASTTPPPTRTPPPPTEIPIVDVIDIPETQEACPVVTSQETPVCASPADIAKQVTPILTENQLKIALIVFFGGGIGALMWVFAANIMNSAQMRREEVRFARQERALDENRRLEQLSKTYGRLSDTIASLYKENGNKLVLNKDAMKNYMTASIELEMFGSEKSLEAHKQFASLLASGNSVSKEAFATAKNDLIAALKTDLGLSN